MARFISQSEMKTWRRCRRKWWLTNVRRLEFDRPPSAGARYLGTKVHAGLEAYYDADGFLEPTAAYDAVKKIHDEDVAKVEAWYAGKELDPTGKIAELAKETDYALIMLQGYFDWLEEEACDAALVPIAAEQELEVPVATHYDQPWHLVAKLDLRVQRTDSGFTAFMDHKTVPNLVDIPKLASMNEQGLTYCIILRLLGEPWVDGMIVNMLRKVKRTATAKPPFYGRHEQRWNTNQLNEFFVRMHGIINDIATCEAQLAAGADHQQVAYPNPTSDCSWDCDYYPICSMFDDGSRVEDAIAAHYRSTDPMARYTLARTRGNE